MLRVTLTLLVALVVAIAAFALVAPASLLDGRLAASTAGRLRLSDAEGTVWRGRGAIGDSRGQWRVPIAWRIVPLSLAQGALAWTFEPLADGSGPRGDVTLREGSVELRNVGLALPAVALRSWAADVPLPEPGGDLRLDAPRFTYDFRAGDGAIDVRWERARLVWNGAVLDLGTVRGRVAPRGADLAGTLDNAGGAARVDGDIALAGSNVTVRATIAPGPDVPPEIARGLAALGTVDANGAVRIEWRTRAQ
jgi:general secretion pathway protein N